MKRYTFNRDAMRDLDIVLGDLREIPERPARRIGKALQSMFEHIAEWPQMGVGYKDFKIRHGYEVRSRLCGNYKIFYRSDIPVPDIIAILHVKRDIETVMRERLE